nr:hypothetical protein [uncultured Steroidobacter sp.]
MKSDRIVARRLVGLLVGVSVAGIPLTLLTFLEPLVLPISPLLMTLLMLVLLIGLPLPLLSALPELAYPRDELSVRNAIRKGQIGAVVLLIAALVAWLVLPHITQGGAGLARKGSILLGAAVCVFFLVGVYMRSSAEGSSTRAGLNLSRKRRS